jgi:predicted nucleic acid-binding protein
LTGVAYDSSLWIQAFRLRRHELLDPERYGGGPIFLSSVVGHELLVGSSDDARRRQNEQLWRRYEDVGRILVPTAQDWREAALVLARIGQDVGYSRVRHGRLTNDALLAYSARRQSLTVVTANVRDFALLARHRSFSFAVIDLARPT